MEHEIDYAGPEPFSDKLQPPPGLRWLVYMEEDGKLIRYYARGRTVARGLARKRDECTIATLWRSVKGGNYELAECVEGPQRTARS